MILMHPSKLASALCALALALAALAGSITAPILIRPFYYAQIDALDLPRQTGWSHETIRQAYDEVLDFCVLDRPFGTGTLAWSESGRNHFADVQKLFWLDFAVLGAALAAAVGMLLLRRAKRFSFYRFCGLGPGFWAGSLAAGLVLLVGGLAALDFDRAFVIFHALFFPGKDNWIFDPAADQIILIMPEVFFRNCALLIGGVLLLLCAALVLSGLPLRRSGSV